MTNVLMDQTTTQLLRHRTWHTNGQCDDASSLTGAAPDTGIAFAANPLRRGLERRPAYWRNVSPLTVKYEEDAFLFAPDILKEPTGVAFGECHPVASLHGV